MFEQSIIEQIAERWNQYQSRHTGNITQKPAPKFELIKTIFETVYKTGLKTEEEVPVAAKVALMDGTSLEGALAARNRVLLFADKMPFTVETLVKLSPAFDPATTAILVTASGDSNDELVIAGVCTTPRGGTNGLDGINSSGCSGTVSGAGPDIFTVLGKSCGHLVILRGDAIICHFVDGEFRPPIPTPFHSMSLGECMYQAVKSHPDYVMYGDPYWHYYVYALNILLSESRRRGHGGTIIWLPVDAISAAHEFINPGCKVWDKGGVSGDLFQSLLKFRKRFYTVDEMASQSKYNDAKSVLAMYTTEGRIADIKRDLLVHLRVMAQMTCVDGALIMSDRLQPLSFGSKLKGAPSWEGKTLTGPDVLYNVLAPVDRRKKGMRHNSAIDFVGACPGSIAFVISQDGPVSALRRHDGETIYWWPDCLSQMWEYRT